MTGGRAGWMTLDSTELFDSSEGSWAAAGAKMPYQMDGLRATSIDDRVLFFGRFLKLFYKYIHTYVCTLYNILYQEHFLIILKKD